MFRLILPCWLALAALLCAPLAYASLSFHLTTGDSGTNYQILPVDSNKCPTQGPIAAYIGGVLTNTGSAALTGIEAELTGLSGSFALTGTQTPIFSVGSLAAGDTAYVAWHITYPCDPSTKGNPGPTITPTITITDDVGNLSVDNLTLESKKSISANAGGQVLSTTLGAGAIVGQTITADVSYDFGGIDHGNLFYLQPAGNTDFDARCLRLTGIEIIGSNITAVPVGSIDQLYFQSPVSQSGNGYFVDVRYSFKYLCAGTTSTARPYALQTSGSTNLKYTGNYDGAGALNFNFPTSTNPYVVSKTASVSEFEQSTGPHIVTYTVTVQNPSAYNGVIDGITDVLPTGATFIALDSASDVTSTNSSSLPTNGDGGTLNFAGYSNSSYSIPAGTTLSLVYTASIPDVEGDYINTADPYIDGSSLGTGQATITVIPAQVELSAVKTVEMANSGGGVGDGYAIPGNEVIYTFTITSTGNGKVDDGSFVLSDVLPPNIIFYNGDFDPNNPGMGPVELVAGGSGIECCIAAGEIAFSDEATAPYTFDYTPGAGFDGNITAVRISPSNEFSGNTTATLSFRAQIR